MTENQSYLDPAKAGELLQRDYREYLMTNHRPDDKLLRGHFNEALENFSLSKGPFLHASPSFKHGASIQSLVDEKILDENFLRLPSDVFPSARPLYAHQEKAIRKILSGRNLIIATGTGSGKTAWRDPRWRSLQALSGMKSPLLERAGVGRQQRRPAVGLHLSPSSITAQACELPQQRAWRQLPGRPCVSSRHGLHWRAGARKRHSSLRSSAFSVRWACRHGCPIPSRSPDRRAHR